MNNPSDSGLTERVRGVTRVFSKAPWEEKVGYCRAVKAGPNIYITGTAPIDDNGQVYAPGDAYLQAKRCLELIAQTLLHFEADCSHIVRTRMFVTDISLWESFGKAHKEVFSNFPPATTMVEVKALIDPKMLIEIEADAILYSVD